MTFLAVESQEGLKLVEAGQTAVYMAGTVKSQEGLKQQKWGYDVKEV